MIDCGSVFRDRKKSCDSDEFRRRSGSSRSDGKRWGRKDTGGGELRCCIQPDLLRSNVDKHWFFEDEQVRINGSVFARRENFDNLLSIIPMSKFNGIHIKMEDDCPQGGDDVRLCLLKTLGAHNQRVVPCVGCHRDMIVYDRYPLVDGVFFLSPVCHFGPPTEVMYDGKKNYLQQLCASCLWADWRCNNCGRGGWFNGKSIVLGTLYYYDIVSSDCECEIMGNYSIMHELITCSSCGSRNYHAVRRMKEMAIM
ncbi:hypothetical protein V3C99_003854 [Haemonchus contortus]